MISFLRNLKITKVVYTLLIYELFGIWAIELQYEKVGRR